MAAITQGVFIVGAKRTAFGTFGGSLKNVTGTQLQTAASKAALAAANVQPTQVDSVTIGNVLVATQPDGIYLPRHVLLHTGIPIERPALGVNRLCGSGFQAIVNAAQDILLGTARISLAGGVDNMSLSPFIVRNVRFGTTLGGNYNLEDNLWQSVNDTFCKTSMAVTAENLAVKYNLTREKVDAFSLRSQQLWKKANDAGVFKTEITPYKLKVKGKDVDFEVDEHPKPQTTAEVLAKLKPVFKQDGVVTAGSASGIADGAAAVVLASEQAVKEDNLKPLARLVAYSAVGVPPEIMGIGPVPAIQNILKKTGLTLDDIDLVEINEAFSAQTLACIEELKLDINKLNVNGGAIAMGHPLAASGARITAHLVHELKRRNLKRGIGAACIGGGQGIAVLVESV